MQQLGPESSPASEPQFAYRVRVFMAGLPRDLQLWALQTKKYVSIADFPASEFALG